MTVIEKPAIDISLPDRLNDTQYSGNSFTHSGPRRGYEYRKARINYQTKASKDIGNFDHGRRLNFRIIEIKS